MKALLIVGLSQEAADSLRDLLDKEGWEIHSCSGWMQVCLRLRERRYHALVCEARLPDGDWRDALDELHVCTNPPPFIVTSRLAEMDLWIDVLDAGGHDLLPYPFDAAELTRVLAQAASRRPARPSRTPRVLVPVGEASDP
jgi:DNA-binding response OmpR family regulator